MNTSTNHTVLTAATALALSLMSVVPVYAQGVTVNTDASAQVSTGAGTVGATVNAKLEARITTAKSHADQEIDRRTTALNDLNTKVQAMQKVSADQKSAVGSEVSTEVGNLATLKAKIDADTDITSLKADIKSITQSYRIFMLVIPQGRIEVAADKISTVGASLTTLAGKLQTRISDAQAAGKNVSTLNTSLTDMNAKIADATVQANAAVSAVASLSPDNGDQATMTANQAAIKDARAKIKAGLADIAAARKDAASIVSGLKAMGGASASASSTTSVQTQ